MGRHLRHYSCKLKMASTYNNSRNFSLATQLNTLAPDKREIADLKLNNLLSHLKQMPWYGQDIHDGSRLAWLYATSDGIDVEDVAHEMATVHFLHQQSSYPSWVQDRLKSCAEILHSEYPTVSWTVLWKLVVRYGVPVVKYASSIELMNHQFEEDGSAEVIDDENP